MSTVTISEVKFVVDVVPNEVRVVDVLGHIGLHFTFSVGYESGIKPRIRLINTKE